MEQWRWVGWVGKESGRPSLECTILCVMHNFSDLSALLFIRLIFSRWFAVGDGEKKKPSNYSHCLY